MTAPAPPDEVELVDETGAGRGRAGKLAAHVAPGHLHRALSAFVLDQDGRLILQRRATSKYHFAGLWSNSCCTHPAPGEPIAAAGERRVREELGIACVVTEVGVFTYRAEDPTSGLVEHEYDHVLLGRTSAVPQPDPSEVAEVAHLTLAEVEADLGRRPEAYTPWFGQGLAIAVAAVHRLESWEMS